jgi:hypothetical protein
MTTNQSIIFEGNTYDKLVVTLAVSPRIITGTPDTFAFGVNVVYTPYRVDDTGKIFLCPEKSWTELHANIADGSDKIAINTFDTVEAAIQAHINAKNF